MGSEFDLQRTINGEPIETVSGTPAEFIAYRPTAEAGAQLIVQAGTDILTYHADGRYHGPNERSPGARVNYGGWAVQYNYDTHKIHVAPVNDLRDHEGAESCWCKPHVDEQGVCVHHAMDGRVEYETDERKPS